jgi:hypothetical protein
MTEFNPEKFLAWLDGQGERAFNYFSNAGCAAASFAREAGGWPGAFADGWVVYETEEGFYGGEGPSVKLPGLVANALSGLPADFTARQLALELRERLGS